MRSVTRRGITLIETLLYVSALSLLLPTIVLSLIRVTQEIHVFDVRNRVNTTASLLFSQLVTDVTHARTVRLSTSTLGVDPSTLVMTDASSQTITIDRATVTVSLPGGNQTIRRLRMQRGSEEAFYLTDPDVDVTSWKAEAVYNQSGTLTGLRLSLGLASPQQLGPFQTATFAADTTVTLSPQTTQD